ncbi:threonine synthase [Streptomyces yaizuensis]|uniref:Pyridoxal-phosphate dependent enzyme n=1 Tax=Streptomyces yaizuensis TaxID=2989713 RepID=A0ABQ5P8N9_9ACTN|nr:threonine synthase [Streptomyces sp. YSPA8]GLF98937.1 pyridoxal-phosphate dependent enzyme [Streptomyces sp. YSPA8]
MDPQAPCYLDERTGTRYPLSDPLRWRAGSGAPLAVTPLPGITRDAVDTGRRSLWRYRAALPVDIPDPVSLGEGCTPLVPADWKGLPVSFKLEWFSPTGSFKDRGTSVLISHLAAHGVTEVIEDSSGNGGSSVAAYCAAAGIRARILVPAATSPAKIRQTRAYGAEVTLVPGDREATAAEALRRAARTPYAGHNWHPLFLQGVKTLAYEIWEDLGFTAPDNVITVAGAGSTVLGCDLGFTELLAAGAIDRLPRLLVAQPANCAPLYASFRAGAETPVPFDHAPTVAEGTAIERPVRLREVLRAIRRSGGDMAALPESAIEDAVRALAARGLYAEPTSATAAAAIEVFAARGAIRPGERTVVVLTGSGLKAADAVERILGGGAGEGLR